MNNNLNTAVPFWPEQNVHFFNKELPLLFREEKNYLDRHWPDNGPKQHAVIKQLKSASRAWINTFKSRNSDNLKLSLLIGKYKILVNIGESKGKNRLWLSGISYANNLDLQRMLENGALIDFKGLVVLTGQEFHQGMEKQTFFGTGAYVSQLLSTINSPWSADGSTQEEIQEQDICSDQQIVVDALQSFIDSEYALEQIAAQQTLPFEATDIKARGRRTTYRLHYEVQFDEDDYARLVESQASLLVLLDEGREPTDVLFEINDLSPIENEPRVYGSVEKQTSDTNIPSNAFFGIAAMPTLKQVRSAVVESLESESTKNPWLLKVAAGVYDYQPLNPIEVPLPVKEFPPTDSQKKAIFSGAGTNDYALVLGPPGTGKTTVILEWVKYFAAQGMRILVTSQNNKAVDNVLERLAEEGELECLRIGNENKISSTLESITLDNKAAELQAKMFGQGDEVLDKLEQQEQYLRGLIAKKTEIIAKVQNAERAEARKRDLFTSLDKLKASVRELTLKSEEQALNHQKLSSRYSELSDKAWPLLGFLSDMYYRIRRGLLKRKINKLEDLIKGTKLSLQTAQTALSEEQIQFQEVEDNLQLLQSQIKDYFSDVESLVDEIDIPGGRDGAISAQEFQAVEDLVSKISSISKTISDWFQKLKTERQQSLYKILIENVNVVGATCVGINTKPLFRNLDFDVVIVDESGQIQLHNLIVPLSRANKAILVGDHKQLPPVVSEEIIEEISAKGFDDYSELYRLSWFEHLWDASPDDHKIMLDTQFRCPAIISDFVSEAFYEGKYFAGVGMDKKKPLLSFCPQPMIWIDTLKLNNKHEKSANQDGRAVVLDNRVETELVLRILDKAIQEHPALAEKNEIGIIVPYANHVKAIQQAIRKQQRKGKFKDLKTPLNELVASVDSFQGQERDLIIFTFTRSNPRGKVGFLSDWRRLNVAQTRAKKQLVMIGDSETLTKGAKRENAHDLEFKKAMLLLKQKCSQKGCLLDAQKFVGSSGAGQNQTKKFVKRESHA